jgi:hypothetical protein
MGATRTESGRITVGLVQAHALVNDSPNALGQLHINACSKLKATPRHPSINTSLPGASYAVVM